VKYLILVTLVFLGSQNHAQALPLLSENAGVEVAKNIILYPDHLDKNLVYFIPNSSVLARDRAGLPQFGLTYWGLSNGGNLANAGAWVSFTMKLASDDDQKAALESVIRSGKRVAVIPAQEATIGINEKSGGNPAPALFTEIHFADKGPQMDQEAGVNMVLTGVGAKVFRKAIETPQALTVNYCYKVMGLSPAFDASISVNMKRVYEYFEANYSNGWWWTRLDIQHITEELRKNREVVITINGGDATMEEYVRKVAESIISRVFVPELKMEPGSPHNSGWGFSRFSLRSVNKKELDQETWNYTQRDKVYHSNCVAMSLKDVKPHKNELVRDADAAE
jgi:hypothetical protein